MLTPLFAGKYIKLYLYFQIKSKKNQYLTYVSRSINKKKRQTPRKRIDLFRGVWS